jgi:hypothetical protein
MTRVGCLTSGKMVVHPNRDVDDDGNQLVNGVAELEVPQRARRDRTAGGPPGGRPAGGTLAV